MKILKKKKIVKKIHQNQVKFNQKIIMKKQMKRRKKKIIKIIAKIKMKN